MLVLDWKERAFIEKVNFKCFCYCQAAIVVVPNSAPIWRLHTKLYRGAWNIWANNSETMDHKDLRLGQIVQKLVFDNVSFSWLLPLDGFQFIFLLRDSENDLYMISPREGTYEKRLKVKEVNLLWNVLILEFVMRKVYFTDTESV